MPGRPSGGGDRFIAVRAVVKCPITPRSTPALLPFTGEGGAKRRMRGASAAKRDLDLPQAARFARALIRLRHLLPHTGEGQCLGRRSRRPTGGMILPPRTCLSAARLTVGCAPRRRYPAPAPVTGPRMQPNISITALGKTYASGFPELKSRDLNLPRRDIFALLGPTSAGNTPPTSILRGT